MSITKNELDVIRQQQLEFHDLVQECDRDELGQCAKLLAMYIAVYKQQFGDIPVKNLMRISEIESIDNDLSNIIQDGIEEASSMLKMVRDEKRQERNLSYYTPSYTTIN